MNTRLWDKYCTNMAAIFLFWHKRVEYPPLTSHHENASVWNLFFLSGEILVVFLWISEIYIQIIIYWIFVYSSPLFVFLRNIIMLPIVCTKQLVPDSRVKDLDKICQFLSSCMVLTMFTCFLSNTHALPPRFQNFRLSWISWPTVNPH